MRLLHQVCPTLFLSSFASLSTYRKSSNSSPHIPKHWKANKRNGSWVSHWACQQLVKGRNLVTYQGLWLLAAGPDQHYLCLLLWHQADHRQNTCIHEGRKKPIYLKKEGGISTHASAIPSTESPGAGRRHSQLSHHVSLIYLWERVTVGSGWLLCSAGLLHLAEMQTINSMKKLA